MAAHSPSPLARTAVGSTCARNAYSEAPTRACMMFLDSVQHLQIHAVRAYFHMMIPASLHPVPVAEEGGPPGKRARSAE